MNDEQAIRDLILKIAACHPGLAPHNLDLSQYDNRTLLTSIYQYMASERHARIHRKSFWKRILQ